MATCTFIDLSTRHIGRFLQRHEIVHHKNENKADYRIKTSKT
jgi:hypothetical protein